MPRGNLARKGEKGNVLFLILIAVALFAALSYAVTQSTRSTGNSASNEKSMLSGAAMTQQPAALRTSLIRMILAGTDVQNMKFNSPANFAAVSDVGELVFHPSGGGATYQLASGDVMEGSSPGTWYFNANWFVPQIGIDTPPQGNDIVAFLPGITSAVCEKLNQEFSINTSGCTLEGLVPVLDSSADQNKIAEIMDDGYTFPSTAEQLQAQSCSAFSGQPSGCFFDPDTNGGEYVFYSVLLER